MSGMDVTNRLEEAIKQVRLAMQEIEDPDVSKDLEEGRESLRKALEALEESRDD